jgi:hypothetical protein
MEINGTYNHHFFENFNGMKNDQNFKTMVGDFDQEFIDLLKEFQETGNRNAHSLFNP